MAQLLKYASITRTGSRSMSWIIIHDDNSQSLGRETYADEVELLDRITGMVRELKADGYRVKTHGFGRVAS